MQGLVIAPTATYRKGQSIEFNTQLNDTIKNKPGETFTSYHNVEGLPEQSTELKQSISVKQTLDPPGFYPEVPAGADKGNTSMKQKIYQDMSPMQSLREYNRQRDLNVFDLDNLYETRPMYNISLPDMHLRSHDLGQI